MAQLLFRRRPAAYVTRKNTAVMIGHSFVANNSAPDASFGSPGVAPTGVFGRTYSKGILERAFIRLNQPFTVLSNMGVVGENSTQILARFGAALALRPGWIFLDCWSNDPFNSPNPSVPLATSIANTTTMIQQANKQGIMVVLCSDAPRTGLTSAGIQQLTTLANTFKDYAVSNPGLIMVDQWPYFADTSSYAASYSGAPLAATVLPDGIHPNSYGAGLVGENAVYRKLRDVVSISPRRSGCNTDGGTNGDNSTVTPNPLLIGTTGTPGTGATGTVATGYTLQRSAGTGITAVGASVTRASAAALFPGLFDDNVPGVLQKISLANAAASTDVMQLIASPVSGRIGSLDGPYVLEMEIGAAMATGTLDQIWNQAFISFASSNISYNANFMLDTADYMLATKFQGVLRTRPFYTPASVNASGHFIHLRMATSANATGDVYVGNMSMRKLLA